MNNRDIKYLNMAVEMARGVPRFANHSLAAILCIKNQVVSTGFNSSKKHPIAVKYARERNKECIYPHAEVVAIHNASKTIDIDDFKKATLYVARVKKTSPKGKTVWGIAKPCEGCQRAIEAFGIKKVVFTLDLDGRSKYWINGEEW